MFHVKQNVEGLIISILIFLNVSRETFDFLFAIS